MSLGQHCHCSQSNKLEEGTLPPSCLKRLSHSCSEAITRGSLGELEDSRTQDRQQLPHPQCRGEMIPIYLGRQLAGPTTHAVAALDSTGTQQYKLAFSEGETHRASVLPPMPVFGPVSVEFHLQ
jgi:hypothetical protein